MTEHVHVPVRTRTIGRLHPEDGTSFVVVDHVFAAPGAIHCQECGKPAHDPGMIGLLVDEDVDDDETPPAEVMLTYEEALVLANRLQRAAALVLEAGEERPDIEREAARFAVPDDAAELADDPRTKTVWAAWRELDDKEPSPVKRIARDLGIDTGFVARVVFPPDKFGHWHDSQEPGLP